MRHYVLGKKSHPVSVRQAIVELFAVFNCMDRIGKNATGLVLTIKPYEDEDTSIIEYSVTDTSISNWYVITDDTRERLLTYVNRLLGTVITTQPYRDALYDFVRDDWFDSAYDRRLFNTIELRKQDDRVLFVVKGSSESPIYGMCYNTILEH